MRGNESIALYLSLHIRAMEVYLLEMFTGDLSGNTKVLVGIDNTRGNETKEDTETKNHEVTNTLRKRRQATEERIFPTEVFIGRRKLSDIDTRHGSVRLFITCNIVCLVEIQPKIVSTRWWVDPAEEIVDSDLSNGNSTD
jgi:hypothetical protein